VECKNKGDASSNKSNWNHFKILQKILEQHTRKAGNQATTENSYIVHSTHSSESANVEAQKEFSNEDSAISTINSTRGIAATLCTLETWFVSGI
jgi:hypothetical protein